ncbi:MAG: SufD family Fe-S cluster assembly protein [Sphingomonadaceae bacterium]|nr:SufD family Fe-S cluster assembly protein [Sphingomonadaceae bacterium]
MASLALPSSREEAWRWSDLSALPALAEARPSGAIPAPDVLWIGDGPRLLFVDGVYDPSRSNPGPVEIGPADARAARHPLGRLAGTRGWRLRIGAEHMPSGTIEIVHLGSGGASHLAAEIEIGEDAQASIVESFAGAGWANRATGITLARSGRLMLMRRILGAAGGFTSLADTAEIGTGASLIATTLAAGAGDSRIDAHLTLAGEEAFAEAGGALLARGQQRHDAALVLRHAEPHGQSRQVWRAVADDQATASVAARVEVARDAQKTDAEQSLRGVLLQRTATINAKPELEIFADDVKCAHGCAVGELDRGALFYLNSRGIPPAPARALLTRAFVADALARIGEEAVREVFVADADNWLSNSPFVSSEVETRPSTSLGTNGRD